MEFTCSKIETEGITVQKRSNHRIIKYGNSLYLFGGRILSGRIETLERLDLETLKWELVTPSSTKSPCARSAHSLDVYKDKFYLLGGISSEDQHLRCLWEFDPRNNTWKELDSSPGGLVDHSTVIYDNKIWAYGGINSNGALYCYDFDTRKWTHKSPSLPFITSSNTAVVYENKMYIFGGFYVVPQASLFTYDFKNDKWEEITDKELLTKNQEYYMSLSQDERVPTKYQDNNKIWPYHRFGHAGLLFRNHILVISGYTTTTDSFFTDVLGFNLETKKWNLLSLSDNPITGRLRHDAAKISSDCVCVFGGFDNNFYQNDLYFLHFESKPTLSVDMKKFYRESILTDFEVFSLDNIPIRAHRSILSARLKLTDQFGNIDVSSQFFWIANKKLKYSQLDSLILYIYSGVFRTRNLSHAEKQQVIEILEKFGLKPDLISFESNYLRLIQDFGNLYENHNSKNFQIHIPSDSKKIIYAHKEILAARTTLYSGMFQCVEDSSNSVPDMSGRTWDALDQLMRFIYSGKKDHIVNLDIANELLDADDFYGLNPDGGLKEHCLSLIEK
ncbi:leucine-zipper-like transcriptional regulator 1 [Anaeramoeba ignava]|uniref:Leucine-zipper-like transcriptional regulator 1 n=1 Tax=Anaeramoeba ignava TaxID=1746090 RepID=A0A9Q0LAV7_ANAIG|nr:leucine-zipper-like transcriptional regulator 1 [Anaeramoeba ignava]